MYRLGLDFLVFIFFILSSMLSIISLLFFKWNKIIFNFLQYNLKEGKNGILNDFFEDEDESFYNDINFSSNPMITDNNNKTNSVLINGNRNNVNNYNNTEQASSNNYFSNQTNEINKQTSGRTLSPAILAKQIQATRNIPLPVSSKRPPHLRLNNN